MHRAMPVPSCPATMPHASSSNHAVLPVNDGNGSVSLTKRSKSCEVLTTIKQVLARGLLKYLR